jgi:hypothetical protein
MTSLLPPTSILYSLDAQLRNANSWTVLAQDWSQYRVLAWRVAYTPPVRYLAGSGTLTSAGAPLLFLYGQGAAAGIPPSTRDLIVAADGCKAFQATDPFAIDGPVFPLVATSMSDIPWQNTAAVPVTSPWGVHIWNGFSFYTDSLSVTHSGSILVEHDVEFREYL